MGLTTKEILTTIHSKFTLHQPTTLEIASGWDAFSKLLKKKNLTSLSV